MILLQSATDIALRDNTDPSTLSHDDDRRCLTDMGRSGRLEYIEVGHIYVKMSCVMRSIFTGAFASFRPLLL